MGVRKTNILRLDGFLGGGLRHNTITTFWAYPGVQNSPFAYHIMREALREGESCVYITSCKSISAIEAEMGSFGLDAAKYVRTNQLAYIDAYSGLVGTTPAGRFAVRNPRDVSSITHALDLALGSMGTGHTLVIYDSVSTLIDHCGKDSLDVLPVWKGLLLRRNATAVFLFTEWPYEWDILERLEDLSDAVVVLKGVEDRVLIHEYLTLLKVSWDKSGQEVLIPFKVDPSEGVILLDPE